MGGGLGHLRRAQAVLAALAPGDPALVFSASPYRLPGGAEVIRVPRSLASSGSAFADWLRAEFRALSPSSIVIDAFPLGILGELNRLPDVPTYHVARLLRWPEYRARFPGKPPRYTETFAVEPLTPRHEAFLRSHSERFSSLKLSAPCSSLSSTPFGTDRPLWLIVHSGPAHEVAALLQLARARASAAATFVVVSPRRDLALPEDVARLDYFPACDLFPFADRIVTACGFNSMREAEPFAAKHLFLPFARRFDHQPLRAARARRRRKT